MKLILGKTFSAESGQCRGGPFKNLPTCGILTGWLPPWSFLWFQSLFEYFQIPIYLFQLDQSLLVYLLAIHLFPAPMQQRSLPLSLKQKLTIWQQDGTKMAQKYIFTSNFVKFLIQFFLFFWRNVLNELNMTLDFTSFCIQILRNSNQNLTWKYNLETRLWSWKYKSTLVHRYLPGNIIVSNIIVRNDILFPR